MKIAAAKRNKKGFTLVELVIVIAVLAILAMIAVPNVTNVINSANENTDKANAQTIELALKSAYAEMDAGTWKVSGTTASSLTVDQALDHEGLINISTMNGKIRQGTTYKFVYDANGQVSCAVPVSGTTTEIVSGSVVKTVINA